MTGWRNKELRPRIGVRVAGVRWRAMEDELFTMMLVVVFAAVMFVAGQVFIDQHKRTEAAILFNNLAVSPGRASPTRY
jgi:hypothetical protein